MEIQNDLINEKITEFMAEAIKLSKYGMENNHGGPFGAVIVKNGEIVGRGFNKVTSSNDPTAHAEVVAIREAAKNLNNFDLSECDIYTSCEPCPMCLSAIYWANINRVFYANTREDAAQIGFRDDFIYNEIPKNVNERKKAFHQISRNQAIEIFNQWKQKEDKKEY